MNFFLIKWGGKISHGLFGIVKEVFREIVCTMGEYAGIKIVLLKSYEYMHENRWKKNIMDV